MRKLTIFKRIAGNKKGISAIIVLGLLLFAAFTIAIKVEPVSAVSTHVPLGTAAYFSVLAGSAITNTGATTITADVGIYPGSSVTGFSTVTIISGTTHYGDATAQNAQTDLTTAYGNAVGQASTATVSADLGGQTLTAGVYTSASSLG